MKKTTILLLIIIFAACGQKPDKKEIIKDIRQTYGEILKQKADSSLTINEFSYECPDDPEMGTITYYSDKSGVKLIEHSFSLGDHYGEENQYFVLDGKLIFYFSKYSHWMFDTENTDDNESMSTVDDVNEIIYYFEKDKPVNCMYKNYKIYSAKKENDNSSDIPNKEVECLKAESVLNKFQKLTELKTSEDITISCLAE